jgi:hypothetical protein
MGFSFPGLEAQLPRSACLFSAKSAQVEFFPRSTIDIYALLLLNEKKDATLLQCLPTQLRTILKYKS